MLKCETNTPEVEAEVKAAFESYNEHELNQVHGRIQADFEHGQWFVTCVDCGAQWSVNDAEGPGSYDGFDFERITEGDYYCEEQEDD